ncbi:MAG: hypothetical protein EPO51_05315 [Phenylobacterium sp.]|uniref:hypothetical protein n=1 Tax=Phenylobacterium sp. TaxID=1871053 RepID=UPI0012275EB2|nr:hypothetical protein [Phenylobacterium sp.]TAJ73421.1 MAG: hypothetical protein EPO51_05315 [Phenylobacterium sp.]
MKVERIFLSVVGALLIGAPAMAQPTNPPPRPSERDRAQEIVSQPARDLGMSRSDIPPVLVAATEDPYSVRGVGTCRQLAAAITELNGALGPDFVVGRDANENRTEKIVEAGGRTIVNSVIPFRSLVREITGAAPAKRALDAAVDAGLARRGFLRGLHRKQGCRTTF